MKHYALIGKSLAHSFSERFFTDFFRKKGIDADYRNIELDRIEEIEPLLKRDDLHGLNVTIPYKQRIIPFLDELDPVAREIGAVNCIRFQNGKRTGFNTDAFGFAQSIKPFLTNRHERAAILGTGGASGAVAYVFEQLGIDVIFVSRNPEQENEFPYSAVNELFVRHCKVIVNTTPLGTWPKVNEMPPFPVEYFTSENLVIDLIYNPAKTVFLEEAEKRGATILNGEVMLREQALKAWEIWNN